MALQIGGYDLEVDKTPLNNFKFWEISGSTVTLKPFGAILNSLILYVFPIAGLILFVLIISSGFQLMTSTGNPETMKKAQQRLTFAVIGFIIIFVSYWLIQILDAILGLNYFN